MLSSSYEAKYRNGGPIRNSNGVGSSGQCSAIGSNFRVELTHRGKICGQPRVPLSPAKIRTNKARIDMRITAQGYSKSGAAMGLVEPNCRTTQNKLRATGS